MNRLAFFLALSVTAASAHGPLPARLTAPSDLVRVGLTDSDTTAGGTARPRRVAPAVLRRMCSCVRFAWAVQSRTG